MVSCVCNFETSFAVNPGLFQPSCIGQFLDGSAICFFAHLELCPDRLLGFKALPTAGNVGHNGKLVVGESRINHPGWDVWGDGPDFGYHINPSDRILNAIAAHCGTCPFPMALSRSTRFFTPLAVLGIVSSAPRPRDSHNSGCNTALWTSCK